MIGVGADNHVENLRRPGGNLTGLSSRAPDLIGKQLALFKEAVPRLSRVAVLVHTDHPSATPTVQQAEKVATALGLSLVPIGMKEVPGVAEAVVRCNGIVEWYRVLLGSP